MKYTSERILVVRNIASSHARDVENGVMDPLKNALGSSQVNELWTPSADRDDIADAVAGAVQDGDRVLVAAGDGTGNSVVNGYLQSGVDAQLGFLPYGNINDMASTFTGKSNKDPRLLAMKDAKSVEVSPIEVMKNNEHFRYALLYATLGWTADAAALFDDPDFRRQLQSSDANLLKSLMKVGGMYFQTRKDSFLPPFTRDGDDTVHEHTTDVLAIGGPIMAKIMRSNEPLYKADTFIQKDLDVSIIPPNIPFLGRSGLNLTLGTSLRLPGSRVRQDSLHFDNASLPLQVDGESFPLTGVDDLAIRKDSAPGDPKVNVLRIKQW